MQTSTKRSFPIFLFNCRSGSVVSGANKKPDTFHSDIILFPLANCISKDKESDRQGPLGFSLRSEPDLLEIVIKFP